MLSENILSAWKDGCRAAEVVNALIIEDDIPTDICSCENPAPSSIVHPCAMCLHIAQCTEMYENQQGFRVCSRCSQEEEKAPAKKRRGEFGTYLPANTHAGHKTAFSNLRTSIDSEAERCGVSSEVASTRVMPAWESIQKYAFANEERYDAYCGVTRWKTSTNKDPFQPNLNAVFPYTPVDGEISYHAPGNLVIISLYVNFLKYAYIPGMLSHVVSSVKSNRGDMALKTFMGEMEDVYLIDMKTLFPKKKKKEARECA